MKAKKATFTIQDIKYKNGVYLVSVAVDVEKGRYKFNKAFKLTPVNGKIHVDTFKELIHKAIVEEVKILEAIIPIEEIKGIEEKITL